MSALPPLQAIVDADTAAAAGWEPAELARAFLAGGASFLQVRAKHLGSRAFLELCDTVVRLAEPCRAVVVINDRADLARMAGAGGVHVGQEDLPPSAARAIVGVPAIVGYSTHTIPQVTAALAEPVTYVAVGPVFGTGTKDTGYRAVGLDLVSAAATLAGARPIVAIGGITLDTAASVLGAGATTVAVISDLLVGDPSARVREYCRRLESRTS